MRELWLEYEAATTPEAKLVKDFDKVSEVTVN
jgi:5'-deoxynucleotidase YfbR-like HD superfamily hydrolase